MTTDTVSLVMVVVAGATGDVFVCHAAAFAAAIAVCVGGPNVAKIQHHVPCELES